MCVTNCPAVAPHQPTAKTPLWLAARRASGTKDEENDPGPTVHTLQLPRFYLPCLKAIKGLESLQSRALQLSRDAYPRTPHLKKQWRR